MRRKTRASLEVPTKSMRSFIKVPWIEDTFFEVQEHQLCSNLFILHLKISVSSGMKGKAVSKASRQVEYSIEKWKIILVSVKAYSGI